METVKAYSKSIPSMSTKLEITILYNEDMPNEANAIMEEGFDEARRLIKIISAWEDGNA